MTRTIHHLIAGLGIAAAASATMAHGDAGHEKAVNEPVRKEQKAWGIAGETKAVTRTIEIRMSDTMRFTPDLIEVREGETLRLVHRNAGKVLHEFVLGTKQALDEHAALMLRFPTMEHDEPYMAHVGPGGKGEIVWTFNRAGEFDFACLIPGHYQAGMVGKVRVAPAASAADMTEGEIRKVDKETNKLTIKHGEIRNLDMPPMTMVFQVKDTTMLDKLKVGDKVRFVVEKSATGYVVTDLRPAP